MKTIFTFLIILFTLPAFAEPEFGEINFTDGGRQADGAQLFGIDIQLEDGWHTYWRLAGQNGLDPVFDFEGSENLGTYEIHWPEPRLVGEEGVEAVGYYEDVRLVISMVPEDSTKPIKLSLNVDIGVCDTQCVPVHREYEETLNTSYSINGIGLNRLILKAFDDEKCDSEPQREWWLFETTKAVLYHINDLINMDMPEPSYSIDKNGMSVFCPND